MDTPRPTIRLTTLVDAPGKPLLLVGPSMGTTSRRLWGGAVLGLDRHVIGWELPGHGDAPTISTPLDAAELAEAVLAAVDAQAPGHAQLDVAGDSIGGAIALLLALQHPDRIRTAATVCSSPSFGEPSAWQERAALVREQGMGPVVEATPARWFGARIQAEPEGRIEPALADLAAVDPESYAWLCEMIAALDLTPSLGGVRVPVLAIAGADDPVSPPEVMGPLADSVQDGRCVVLDGIGHLAPLEDPEGVAAVLAEHLARA